MSKPMTFADAAESSQAFLGALLVDPAARAFVPHVKPEHLSEPLHAALLEDIDAAMAKGRTPTVPALADAFKGNRAFDEMGGAAWLFDLVDRAPPSSLIGEMGEAVLSAFVRRGASERLSQGLRELSEQPDGLAVNIVERLKVDLDALSLQSSAGDSGAVTAQEAALAYLADLDAARDAGGSLGLPTGLDCFDGRLGGLRAGHLVIVAGRPSMGKSGLARAAAFGCGRLNPAHQVLFFSLEMPAGDLAARGLSDTWHSVTPTGALAYSRFHAADRSERLKLGDMVERLPVNVQIIDRAGLSVEDIKRRVWQAKRKGPVGAVFIDYLQIMRRPAYSGRNETTVIGEMTQALAALAKDAGCAVVLLSQLNRDVEKRDDKRPQLSDLRDSGAIEQDANAVLLCYRRAYYLERSEPQDVGSEARGQWKKDLLACQQTMEVICAKNRAGKVGVDLQTYRAEYDGLSNPTSGGRA
jgi:replicative DNA helicase